VASGGSSSSQAVWGVLADDALELYDRLARVGVSAWICGGWGIDAIVGEQTRPHDDLDLVISREAVKRAVAQLADYSVVAEQHDQTGAVTRVVLRDRHARGLDLYPVVFDGHGNGWHDVALRHVAYPADDLGAGGRLGSMPVRCVSARLQLELKTREEPDELDHHDVLLLVDSLGAPPPPGHGTSPGWVHARRIRVVRALIGQGFARDGFEAERLPAPPALTTRLAELRAGVRSRRLAAKRG
jgi:lincosamide nucleotidyltransferase A/C/D/E